MEDKDMKMNKVLLLTLVGSLLLTACGAESGKNDAVKDTTGVSTEIDEDTTLENSESLMETQSPDESGVTEEPETPKLSEETENTEEPVTLEESETSEAPDTSEEPESSEEPETSVVPDASEDDKDSENSEEPEVLVYTYKALNITLYAKSSVNVRSLPAVEGSKVGHLSKGDEVIVTGQCNETSWYRIVYNGEVAYVSNNYLISEKPQTEVEAPQKEYSMEDLDGDGKADLAEYTTWNGMTVYTEFCTPSEAKFKRDLCYAGLYVPMKYTAPNGYETYYMLLDKSDENNAEERFKEELWKIGVSSQVSSTMKWTKEGDVIAIWSVSFLTNYEYELEVTETLYNVEYYVSAKGKPQVNYFIIIMNGYEEDTFPYMIIGTTAFYPDYEYGCLLGVGDDASLPNENGEYVVTDQFDEMKTGKYIFKGYYFGGMTITDYGFRTQEVTDDLNEPVE